jgi:hypothetical protein
VTIGIHAIKPGLQIPKAGALPVTPSDLTSRILTNTRKPSNSQTQLPRNRDLPRPLRRSRRALPIIRIPESNRPLDPARSQSYRQHGRFDISGRAYRGLYTAQSAAGEWAPSLCVSAV